ncbi:hypothetical protein [uncultured Leifsonia sp.]|uniref:hypothetical protein n=1 Tax=uncultured Leifsonia sp. TaxID=340359 RepID=UPI0025D3306C|nr:hypothetical protein [uncultured Leifsonia sp.]
MLDLRIEVVARNELGAIVALVTPHGVVDAQHASSQIARGEATYVTGPDSYSRVPVRAISTLGGAYLYANWDGTQRNNLHDLAAVRVRTPPADAVGDALATVWSTRRGQVAALWGRLFPASTRPRQGARSA